MQAHFAQLNDRDEAMSRSLNSDYLDQLLIKADTSGLDGDLVRLAAEERPVPEEQQALLVFKRGFASQLHPLTSSGLCWHQRRRSVLHRAGAGSAAVEELDMPCPSQCVSCQCIALRHAPELIQQLSQGLTAGADAVCMQRLIEQLTSTS